MDCKSARFLLVSTATIIVATQVVKRFCNYFFSPKKSCSQSKVTSEECNDMVTFKTREINDVIIFSDDIINHTNMPSNKDVAICESRELNCFKLIKYIKSARETLDICMYLITSSEITEQIIRLGQRHILIRIFVDSDMAFTPLSQIRKLKEYSFIQVQTNKKSILMHHKFCIVDGPKAIRRKNILREHAEKLNIHAQLTKPSTHLAKVKQCKGFVMSGSLNWSTRSMVLNNESVIVTSNTNILNKFEKEFESLWTEDKSSFLPTL